jgi:hypothetical protein
MDRPVSPSRWWYAFGAAIIAAGFAGFVVVLLQGILGLSDSLVVIMVPGEKEMDFPKAGTCTVFHEYASMVGGRVYSNPSGLTGLICEARPLDGGSAVPLQASSVSSSYTLGDRHGVSIGKFDIDRPGTWVVSARYPDGAAGPPAVLAAGMDFAAGLLRTLLDCFAFVLGGILFGTVVIVAVAIKREKSLSAARRAAEEEKP